MSRVAKRIGRRARRDQGGASTIIAVLLAGGVLIGMTALVVDVGRFYMEREELQSGADAAANKIAMECINNRSGCVDNQATLHDLAKGYANDNAKDELSQILSVCGLAPNPSTSVNRLPNCGPPPTDNLTNCIGTVPAGVKYVEVRTMTQVPDGDTVLPASFAGALVPGYEGTTVGACSRVGWGPPAGGIAFTFSFCEWNEFTSNGTNLAPPPPAPPDPSFERRIRFHGPKADEAGTCPASEPGGDPIPGGFGWLDETGGDCLADIVDGTYGADPGDNVSQTCRDKIKEAYESGEPQLVPVYDDLEGKGQPAIYEVAGVAAFVITGYNLPGPDDVPPMNPANLCTGEDHCVYGYFTEALLPASAIGAGEDMGATVIKTIG